MLHEVIQPGPQPHQNTERASLHPGLIVKPHQHLHGRQVSDRARGVKHGVTLTVLRFEIRSQRDQLPTAKTIISPPPRPRSSTFWRVLRLSRAHKKTRKPCTRILLHPHSARAFDSPPKAFHKAVNARIRPTTHPGHPMRNRAPVSTLHLGNHLHVAAGDGEVEAAVFHLRLGIDAGVVFGQDFHHGDVAFLHCKVDRLLLELVLPAPLSASVSPSAQLALTARGHATPPCPSFNPNPRNALNLPRHLQSLATRSPQFCPAAAHFLARGLGPESNVSQRGRAPNHIPALKGRATHVSGLALP